MSKLVVFMSMSLDGFVAAEGDGPGRGLGIGGEPLHAWLGLASRGSTRPGSSANADVVDEMMATGAVVVGRHTFEWAGSWNGDHHDGVPIFVLTKTVPDYETPELATYVTDPDTAVASAKAAAGERDVMMHGASALQALLRAGLVDELVISVIPILLGRGRRLFDDLPPEISRLRLQAATPGDGALHLRYEVERPREPASGGATLRSTSRLGR